MEKPVKKIYLIAGEASGDLHAANLIRSMKLLSSDLDFRVWGGDHCIRVGAKVVKHIRELAFMGFVEVLFNLKTIVANLQFCKRDLLAFKPDILILVDYPGFNLRIAKWAKSKGIRVVYYISPQLWAWKEGRIKQIRENVDQMLVILPFEKEFYKKHKIHVDFVGHPLLDVIDAYSPAVSKNIADKPMVALLPGSRLMEVKQIWPVMLEAVKRCKEYQFVLAMASNMSEDDFVEMRSLPNLKIVKGKTYEVLIQADAALVTSGTATLETALFAVPEVVCYKGHWLSYWIAKTVIKVNYISLVNLILNRPLVTELIQNELNPLNLIKELNLLFDPNNRGRILNGYAELKEVLGKSGASDKAAGIILNQ